MLDGKRDPGIFSDESPEIRTRMPDVLDSFERLEKELRQHIEQLRLKTIHSSPSILSQTEISGVETHLHT
jgi:hypothetical protein